MEETELNKESENTRGGSLGRAGASDFEREKLNNELREAIKKMTAKSHHATQNDPKHPDRNG